VQTAHIRSHCAPQDQVRKRSLKAVTARTRLSAHRSCYQPHGVGPSAGAYHPGADARGRDTLVDGAHAPAWWRSNGELRPAYFTGNLHKWVCGAQRRGFSLRARRQQLEIQPAVISHGNNTPGRIQLFSGSFRLGGHIRADAWVLHWSSTRLDGGGVCRVAGGSCASVIPNWS